MEETIPENQIKFPNSVTNDILHKMDVNKPQETSEQYLAEKPSSNPVNSSSSSSSSATLGGGRDSSKECNMHLLANAVDSVMYSPPGSDAESGANLASETAPYKDDSLSTTSNPMNIAVGLISTQNYPSSAQDPSCPMPSSNFLTSGSTNSIPASPVSSMHATSSSMQYVNSVTPSSIPAQPSHVSGNITESPSSSQHAVDTSAGTMHRPTNSMPDISTMLQPTSSGLKSSSTWPSGQSAGTEVSSIPTPAVTDPDQLYNPLSSSLQSNVTMSSSSSQFQMASSSIPSEHKPNTSSSPFINSMLGVSSSLESQSNISSSKKANLCSSDSTSHNTASVSHLNVGENGPTSSAPAHNSLHSTTGSQGYTKPNAFSQPSSTMPSQGEAAASSSSSMLPEPGQLSSAANNYPVGQSVASSGPSSSESSEGAQVASSSFGNLSSGLNSGFSDLRDPVSGSTDLPLGSKSDSLSESNKVVSDTASVTSHIANTPLEKAKVTSASGEKVTSASGERVIPASSSDAQNTILQKVPSTSVEKVSSGSNDKVTSASGDKVTSASGNKGSNGNNKADSDKGMITSQQSSVTSGGKNNSKVNNISSEAEHVTSGSGNSSSKLSSASSIKTRPANSSIDANTSVADCSNSSSESSHDTQMIDSSRSNVSSSLIKSDQDSLNPSGSTSVQNSLHGKESVKGKKNHFSEEDTNSPMKADSSSNSLKTKHVSGTSISKEDNSCSSTIADLDTNCTNSKRPNKKSEPAGSIPKANSTVSDSTSSINLKDGDETMDSNDTDPDPPNPVQIKEESSDSPMRMADSAEDQVEEEETVNKKKSSVECADTSTCTADLETDSESESPSGGLKRKRSQSPVSSSLGEPRRSRRQSKSKFNVLDVVGTCINIDYSLEDEKRPPAKEVVKSPAPSATVAAAPSATVAAAPSATVAAAPSATVVAAPSASVVADSSLTDIATDELVMDVAENEMDEMLNNSYESMNRSKFKEKIDMEKIIAPFEEGWKREVVIRGVYEEYTKSGKPKRVPADVYYYAPNKRKLRSMVQIVNYLREHNSSLTSENFNFMRRSIYKAPFESVRQAGSRSRPLPKSPKVGPLHTGDEDELNVSMGPEFEMALAASALTVMPSRWSPGKKEKSVKSEPVVKMEIEDLTSEGGGTVGQQQMIALPMLGKRPLNNYNLSAEKKPKKTKSVARKSTCQLPKSAVTLADVISKAEPFQPCSLSCPGLVGIPPTLHCDICMCLFHIACVNLKDNEVPKVFTCKNCMKDERIVRHKLLVNATTATETISVPSAIMAKTTVPCATNTTTSSMLSNKAIFSVASIISPNSNIINSINDNNNMSITSESDKKAKKSGAKPSVIQSSFKESAVTIVNVALPTKHSNGSRQVVVLNGSPGTESSPIQIPAEDDPKAVTIPDSSDHVTCTQSSVRSSIKANKNPNSSPLIFRKSSPPVTPLSAKDRAAASSTTSAAAASIITTTVTTPSSSSITNVTAATAITSASTYSIDCTEDLTLKNSSSESPMIVSPSKLLAAPSHTLPSSTTSSSVKMEMLSSSSSSSSSSTHALSGVQVSNTLLGSETYPRSGQLLTLPSAVAKRLNPSLPLALRINNMQLLIPPSRCINTAEGLKVFLPPKTFSVPSGSTTTMNITFSSGSMSADNAKDLSLSMLGGGKDKSMSIDMCDQVVDLSKTAETSKPVLKVTERRNKMKNYLCPFKALYSGYDSMIQIFSYLSAGDLVRCSLVCRTWRRLATQSCLWNAIHLENTRISDWARATQFFKRYSVEELSLRGMQYEDDWNRVWHQLTPVLESLTTLKRLYFDHVPALMLYTVCQKLPQLEDLGANMISDFTNEQQWTTPTRIDLAKFCNLKQLRKLQLRGTGGLASSFSSGISGMVSLKFLNQLSLTTMKDVGDHDLDFLGELKQLRMLEMGDCTNWTSETYFQLGKLVNLQKLRLEHGGEIPDVGLADALLNLKSLQQLELISFVIVDTLHLALSQLKNLRKLVVWPDTSNQPALVNSNTFVTVIKLPTLKQLEWGVVRNKYSSIILNESRGVNAASNSIMGSEKDLGDNVGLIPFLSPDAHTLASQIPNNNGQMLSSSSGNFTEYIGMRQLSEKLKCLLTHTQVTVFRTFDDASCVSSW